MYVLCVWCDQGNYHRLHFCKTRKEAEELMSSRYVDSLASHRIFKATPGEHVWIRESNACLNQ